MDNSHYRYMYYQYISLEKGVVLYPRMLCAMFGWNWHSSSIEEAFKMLSMYFCNYMYHSLVKDKAFHFNKLESFLPKMFCVEFGQNWPSGSVDKDENVNSLRWKWQWKVQSEKLTWAFSLGELRITTWFIMIQSFRYSML